MDNLLQGVSYICVYLDHTLVTGRSNLEYLHNLDYVLTSLEKAGIRPKRSKCEFMLSSVKYLGHQISEQGLQSTDEKVRAIKDAPAPKDAAQLKSFLGIINYCGKFLPKISSNLAPLYKLLQK